MFTSPRPGIHYKLNGDVLMLITIEPKPKTEVHAPIDLHRDRDPTIQIHSLSFSFFLKREQKNIFWIFEKSIGRKKKKKINGRFLRFISAEQIWYFSFPISISLSCFFVTLIVFLRRSELVIGYYSFTRWLPLLLEPVLITITSSNCSWSETAVCFFHSDRNTAFIDLVFCLFEGSIH